MTLIKLKLPYPPSVNGAYAVVRGRKVLSANGRDYKANVGVECMAARLRPFQGNVAIRLDVYRPRRTGDLDNVQKLLFDALKGHAWNDDKQIVEIHAYRHDDKKDPRVEIEIEQVGEG